MAEFDWTVDDIKRAQRDFSNNFMRLDCIRTESYDVAIDCMTECIEKKAADVQPLSVVAEHIKNRLYETAFNTDEPIARDAIADMAERIDFWIDELKDGDTE